MERGAVYDALRELARRLGAEKIPYAVLGAMALAQHGMRRPTLDVDLLMTAEGLAEFQTRFVGLGYVPAFPGARKTFRDTQTGVRIEVITSGEYPGDGKPKPVRFPDPQEASEVIEGIHVVKLERLIELKLASGMTAAHRRRDLSDVQDLIRTLHLPADFAGRVDPSVRAIYQQLWSEVQEPDPFQDR